MKLGKLASVLRQGVEGFSDVRSRGLQQIERRWLGPSQYTGVFPLRAAPASGVLQAALENFESTRALAGIPGLLGARWLTLPCEPVRLRFEFTCTGNVLDALEELGEQAVPAFDAVLEHCEGYPGRGDHARWLAFFRKRRIRSTSLFRLFSDADPLHGGTAAPGRRDERAASDASAEPPLALTQFERPLDQEGGVLQLSMQFHRARARRDARARQRRRKNPSGLRGVHAKHHGLLMAQFRVHDDVPPEFRHGVLAPGAKYDAWVRPSNADPTVRPDWLPDGHGLAIKLLGIEGPPLLELSIPDGIAVPAGRTQDFALVSHPTFFMRNARDYLLLRSLLDARPDQASEWLELLTSASVYWLRRPREFSILSRTLLRWCRHPLLVEYHSLVAFLLGPGNAVKWSVRPTPATARALAAESPRASVRGFISTPADYLKSALQRSLDAPGTTPLEFEVALHVAGEQTLPVEDPTVDWDKQGARRVVVATLTIPAQDATSPACMASAQNMVISPWHTLAAHRPLGSLNRARLGAYLASSQERGRANGIVAQGVSKPASGRTSARGRAPERMS